MKNNVFLLIVCGVILCLTPSLVLADEGKELEGLVEEYNSMALGLTKRLVSGRDTVCRRQFRLRDQEACIKSHDTAIDLVVEVQFLMMLLVEIKLHPEIAQESEREVRVTIQKGFTTLRAYLEHIEENYQ